MIKLKNIIIIHLLLCTIIACSHKHVSSTLEDADYTIPVTESDTNKSDKEIVTMHEANLTIISNNKQFHLYKNSDTEIRFHLTNDVQFDRRYSPIYQQMEEAFKKDRSVSCRKNVFISLKRIDDLSKGVIFIWTEKFDTTYLRDDYLAFPRLNIDENTDTLISNLNQDRISDLFPNFKGIYIQRNSIRYNNNSAFVHESWILNILKLLDNIAGINDIYLFDSFSKSIYNKRIEARQ